LRKSFFRLPIFIRDFMVMRNKGTVVAVLSGKGGTGKTLISVNLARVSGECRYLDCDVEEPNGYLFFKPENPAMEEVTVEIPEVLEAACNGCRKCVDFCRFNAMAFIKEKPYIFPEVCHSCGGCMLLCPEKALVPREKTVGRIEEGKSGEVTVVTGILNVGEASGMPVIKKLTGKYLPDQPGLTFIDCPPGSACTVMESIRKADYCILVAEPTLFGEHNLRMVYDLTGFFKKRSGVVLNKCSDGTNPSEDFCRENHIPVLGRIPFDMTLGILTSDAKIAADEKPEFADLFKDILENLKKEVSDEAALDSER